MYNEVVPRLFTIQQVSRILDKNEYELANEFTIMRKEKFFEPFVHYVHKDDFYWDEVKCYENIDLEKRGSVLSFATGYYLTEIGLTAFCGLISSGKSREILDLFLLEQAFLMQDEESFREHIMKYKELEFEKDKFYFNLFLMV